MGEFIKIQGRRCCLYLTADEIQGLLKHDPVMYAEALKRGKAFTRNQQQGRREAEKIKKHYEAQELKQAEAARREE